MRLQIEQIQRDTAGRGGAAGPNGGDRGVFAGRGDNDGARGYEVQRAGRRGVVGDGAVMVEQTVL